MKKVLYMLACDIDFTGTPLFVNDLINNLNSNEYECYVYTPGIVKNKIYNNVHIYEGGVQLTHKFIREIQIKRSLKRLKKQHFDIVHINTSNIHIANMYVSYFYRRAGKIICHSHNVITYKKGNLYGKIIDYKKQNIVKISDVLFACSSEAGEAMFGKDAHYALVRNFLDPNKFKFNQLKREEFRKKIGYDVILGNIGAFNGQKNQIFLLKLMKQLDNRFALVLVGNGQQKEECIQYCKENKLNNVFFFDSTADVQLFYSSFDMFLLPSLFEGFGRVVLEALISNLDIITSNDVPISSELGLTHLPLELDRWKTCVLQKVGNLNPRMNVVEIIKEHGYDADTVMNVVEGCYR